MEALNIIATQFPDAVPMLQKPGVAQVYMDAVSASPPWTNAQLQAALRATPYYQQTPGSVRDFDILKATDPATATQKATDTKRVFDDMQRQLGVTLNTDGGFASQSFTLFTRAVNEGWDANRIKYEMLNATGTQAGGGELGKTATDVKSMANQYGVPLSDASTMDFARKMSEGAIDQAGLQGYMIEQAKSLFPSMTAALDRGITVKQYASPYLQIAQQELGVDPDTVDLTDKKWLAALNQVDPKTGDRTPMSLDQWLKTVRSDPSYGYDTTNKAKADATSLMGNLGQMFGATA